MEEERDVVVFTDDQGNDIELEVLDYFFYNGQEYAVLTDVKEEDDDAACDCGHSHAKEETSTCDCGHDHGKEASCDCGEDHEGCDSCKGHEEELYIMKVLQLENDMEEFVPVEDDLVEKLIEIVQTRFDEDFDEDDEDEDEEGDDK